MTLGLKEISVAASVAVAAAKGTRLGPDERRVCADF